MNKAIKRPDKISMHQLSASDINKFKNIINKLRSIKDSESKEFQNWLKLLPEIKGGNVKRFSNSPSIDLTLIHKTRFELSKYLFHELNEFIKNNSLVHDPYFWTWLALVYFEDLTNKFKKVDMPSVFITDMGDFNLGRTVNLLYKHSIREGYLMYAKYKEESKIYFSKSGLAFSGEMWEQTRSRGATRTHMGFHKFVLKTYQDPKGTGFARKNSGDKDHITSWCIRRLCTTYSKLSVNYAVPLLSSEDYENILGDDFKPDLENSF